MSSGNPTRRSDVAVVGGGPAGLAAAFAAALGGASVLLVDRGPLLGGNIGNALVHTICGLYEAEAASSAPGADTGTGATTAGSAKSASAAVRAEGEAAPRLANGGFASAFAASLGRVGAAGAPERVGRVWVLPIDPRGVSRLARELFRGERQVGVAFELGLELIAAHARTDGFALELCDSQRNRYTVEAPLAIDASGDGDLAFALGADVEVEAAWGLQHPSFIVELEGVDPVELAGFERVRTTAAVARAARTGDLPAECESVVVRPAAFADASRRAFLTFTFPKPEADRGGRGAYDPFDAQQRKMLGEQARERASRVVSFLVRTRPTFARARIVRFPERIGVREGRRVLGSVVLDRAHVVEGRAHADEVARSSWPIELWHAPGGVRFEHPSGSCAIPLGALTSRSHTRLGTAGRCLSATHEAHGALRVVGTALATGEAIGIAAALAYRAGTTLAQVDPAAVRETRERLAPRLAELLAAAETRFRSLDRSAPTIEEAHPRAAAWGPPERGQPGPRQA